MFSFAINIQAETSSCNNINLELDNSVIECSNSDNVENQNIDNNSINDVENEKSKYLRFIESVYNGSTVIELPSNKWMFIKGRNNKINFCMSHAYEQISEYLNITKTEFSKQVCTQLYCFT